jgi:hypothetical protein
MVRARSKRTSAPPSDVPAVARDDAPSETRPSLPPTAWWPRE